MMVFALAAAWAFEPLEPGWPKPIHDRRPRGMILFDQLEYRIPAVPGTIALDGEGWWGPDRDRLRYRFEGETEVGPWSGEGEASLSYSRLVGPWLELQIGVGGQGLRDDGLEGEARVEAGVEYVVPQDIDLEGRVRVSHRGRVSSQLTASKDWLFTQRLILQTRAEVIGALQQSKELDTPQGLEELSAGVRLRYEIRRQFAPYVGVRWEGSMASPSESAFQQQFSGVGGVRSWF